MRAATRYRKPAVALGVLLRRRTLAGIQSIYSFADTVYRLQDLFILLLVCRPSNHAGSTSTAIEHCSKLTDTTRHCRLPVWAMLPSTPRRGPSRMSTR